MKYNLSIFDGKTRLGTVSTSLTINAVFEVIRKEVKKNPDVEIKIISMKTVEKRNKEFKKVFTDGCYE